MWGFERNILACLFLLSGSRYPCLSGFRSSERPAFQLFRGFAVSLLSASDRSFLLSSCSLIQCHSRKQERTTAHLIGSVMKGVLFVFVLVCFLVFYFSVCVCTFLFAPFFFFSSSNVGQRRKLSLIVLIHERLLPVVIPRTRRARCLISPFLLHLVRRWNLVVLIHLKNKNRRLHRATTAWSYNLQKKKSCEIIQGERASFFRCVWYLKVSFQVVDLSIRR